MEMEQLLSMGFPDELAAQALAATGGKSTLKATEWILSHKSNSSSSSVSVINPTTSTINPNPSSTSPSQPKLDRFFHFQSKQQRSNCPPTQPTPHLLQQQQQDEDEDENKDKDKDKDKDKESTPPPPPISKRPKLQLSSSNSLQQPKNHSIIDKTHDHEPLSERIRPLTIYQVVGQDHLLANNSLLRSAIDCNRLHSIIFWGPPGTGKTTIAKSIVNSSQLLASTYKFVSLSAVTCGVKDVRDVVEDARKLKIRTNKRTVLFVDEVHRFNKSQQDSFLPVIEDGSIVFMGATTENPSFHLITPLLSRCRVLTLNPLKPHHLETLLRRAVTHEERGLTKSVSMRVEVNDDAIEFLTANSDGDARVALNALEISATTAAARLPNFKQDPDEENGIASSIAIVTLDDAKEALQCKHLAYDKAGEEHYNLISALHKSMRGSDADAAIYWLARMLEGGEQPLYIARRLIVFASEDVGLADPTALNQAVACYQACHFLGMPECDVNLAQCVAYLALAPKSISVYRAIKAAQKVVRESIGQNEGVPLHLRNAPTKLMKEIGYGKGYIYPPDNPSSSTQTYLPPSLKGYKFLDWPNNNTTDV